MVFLSPVGYGVWLTFRASAKHQIPQATTDTLYQPLLIKPMFSVLAHAEKQFVFKTNLPVFVNASCVISLVNYTVNYQSIAATFQKRVYSVLEQQTPLHAQVQF